MVRKYRNQSRTIKDKFDIIKYYDNLPPAGAKTATIKKFKIASIGTLNYILEKRKDIEYKYESGLANKARKNLKNGVDHDVDEQIYEWVCWLRSKNVELSASSIIEKKNQLMKERNIAKVATYGCLEQGFSKWVP